MSTLRKRDKSCLIVRADEVREESGSCQKERQERWTAEEAGGKNMKGTMNILRIPICIGLFIYGFNLNMELYTVFGWLHEYGHVLAAGNGRVLDANTMVYSGESTAWICYGGVYGEVFFETLIIVGLAIIGWGLYVQAFVFGGMIAVILHPLYVSIDDWAGATAFDYGLFYVYHTLMTAICLTAILYAATKYYMPDQYVELPFVTKAKELFKKQKVWTG